MIILLLGFVLGLMIGMVITIYLIDQEYEVVKEPKGTYQCFHCGEDTVVWGADFSFEDYGLEGEGIVHSCHCANCGADIEYYVRLDEVDE